MINGVIFDMDGTMFDTERMWATFWDPALKALGLPYKEGLAEAARGTAGGLRCRWHRGESAPGSG